MDFSSFDMSAFVPASNNDGGHPNQAPSSSFNYPQLPYFAPMIGQYFPSSNGYQFNPTGGISGTFPNLGHNPTASMNPMNNLHSQSQIPQIPVDNTFRLLQNNQLSLYNNSLKNEFIEPSSIVPSQNNPLINDSKSSSTNDSLGSGDSSPVDENRTPARVIKPTAKIAKHGFKSPEEESAYRVRRQKNNEAARQSRVRRQQRERQLQDENDHLKRELELWKKRYNDLVSIQIKPNNHVLAEIQNHKH